MLTILSNWEWASDCRIGVERRANNQLRKDLICSRLKTGEGQKFHVLIAEEDIHAVVAAIDDVIKAALDWDS